MSVLVTSPSRLHFGLIDLNGELGRVDGGIGVALNEPSLKIEVSAVGEGGSGSRNGSRNGKYRVKILKSLPSHVGLGSRTQLSLSVAKAISVLENQDRTRDRDRERNAAELAKQVGRGGTSGIGTAAFENGGFILDGGHAFQRGEEGSEGEGSEGGGKGFKTSFLPSSASKVPPPPVLFQHPLPEDWFFVVAIPGVQRGAHGVEEVEIFRRCCPIKREEVEKICRLVLVRILPAVLENDLNTFAASLTGLQTVGFKKIEVGLQHEKIKELFGFFDAHPHALGYGMSSFGPATYAVVEGERRAEELAAATKEFLDEKGKGDRKREGARAFVTYSNANNSGSEVEVR